MHEIQNPRMVLQWTCAECKYVNIFVTAGGAEARAELTEFAKEEGLDPNDLSIIPDVICCAKCEEPHEVPMYEDDEDDEDEEDEDKY